MAKKKKKKRPKAEPTPPKPVAAPNRAGVAIAIVLLAGLAIAVAIVGKRPPPDPVAPPPALTPIEKWQAAERKNVPLLPENFGSGPEDAPITIVEYSDFECPFCREASNTLEIVKELYRDKVRHVYKDFPLDTACHDGLPRQVHVFGCRTAVMARCAGAQGRFWEMHDALFSHPELSEAILDALPGALDLDAGPFDECVAAEETMALVRRDVAEGKELGVTATPTIFVNGREAPSFHVLQEIVEHILSTVP